MSYYYKLFPLYDQATTWQEFLNLVSVGPGKWSLLQAIEGGWKGRIQTDLCKRFNVPVAEVCLLLDRFQSIVNITPMHTSTAELTHQLGQIVHTANTLRSYFRYAYYIAADDPDTIFTILDENLTKLGAGTPSPDECAKGYTKVTGKCVNPDAVVLSAEKADEIAYHLAAESEDIHKRLTQTVDAAPKQAVRLTEELERLDRLHIELTGKSVIDIEAIRDLKEYLTACTQNTSGKND